MSTNVIFESLLASLFIAGCVANSKDSRVTNPRPKEAENLESSYQIQNPLTNLDQRNISVLLIGQEYERKIVIPQFQIDDQELIGRFIKTMRNAKVGQPGHLALEEGDSTFILLDKNGHPLMLLASRWCIPRGVVPYHGKRAGAIFNYTDCLLPSSKYSLIYEIDETFWREFRAKWIPYKNSTSDKSSN